MKISWAGTVIVIVGKETHERPWVNWEIEQAHRKGKKIVGVYENGLKDRVELPQALEKYGTSQVVGWGFQSIISAIEGDPLFQNLTRTPSAKRDGLSFYMLAQQTYIFMLLTVISALLQIHFHGYCTLATCKPGIRKSAHIR
jgi:hypothetical protein